MIAGISHITLIVNGLARMQNFLEVIFDAQEVYSCDTKQFSLSAEKFFLIGEVWVCIMQGDSLLERTYNHIAFKIPEDEFDAYSQKIKSLGVDVRPERPRVEGEGRSIYFHDFDNHLFELHTSTLAERLKRYKMGYGA